MVTPALLSCAGWLRSDGCVGPVILNTCRRAFAAKPAVTSEREDITKLRNIGMMTMHAGICAARPLLFSRRVMFMAVK